MMARSPRDGNDDRDSDGTRRPGREQQEIPLIQWIVSAIAVVILLASFGLIIHDGFIAHSGPPAISVAVDSIGRSGEMHRVHVHVRNDGGTAARDVQVSGASGEGAAPTVLRFDYLPAGSEESAVFLFAERPDSAGLRVQVESWGEP